MTHPTDKLPVTADLAAISLIAPRQVADKYFSGVYLPPLSDRPRPSVGPSQLSILGDVYASIYIVYMEAIDPNFYCNKWLLVPKERSWQ
jgi:hypothetical protein